MDMDFAVSCPLVRHWRLISGFCPSTRTFAQRFLQTSPRGDSPCVLASPSPPSGWAEDSHLLAAEHAQHTTKPLRGSWVARAIRRLLVRSLTPPDLVGRFLIQCWRFLANAGFRSLISIGWSHLNRKEFHHDRATP